MTNLKQNIKKDRITERDLSGVTRYIRNTAYDGDEVTYTYYSFPDKNGKKEKFVEKFKIIGKRKNPNKRVTYSTGKEIDAYVKGYFKKAKR